MPLLSTFAAAGRFNANISPLFDPIVRANANVVQSNEGTTINLELVTSPTRPDGNIIYWDTEPRSEGTIILNTDLLSGNTGTITLVTGGVATLALELAADAIAEGPETFRVRFRDVSTTGPIIGYGPDIVINDTSGNTNIKAFANTTTINETTNNAVTFNVIGFGRTLPNTVYWTTVSVSGNLRSNTDFTDNVWSGSVVLTGNNVIAQANITRVISSDAIVEGGESFYLEIRDGSQAGDVIITTPTVTVVDTSNNNVLIQANVTTIAESPNYPDTNAVQFTVIGNTRPDGNVVYWSIRNISGNVLNTDFVGNANTGSIVLSGTPNFTSNTLTLVARQDYVNDGNMSFQLEVRDGSSSGQLVGLSPTITIFDTSNTAVIVTPNVAVNSVINETSNVVIQWDILSYGGRPAGNVVYWELIDANTGNVAEIGDFSDGTGGTATTGSIALAGVTSYATANIWKRVSDFRFVTEGQERLALRIRDTSLSGIIVGLSGNVLINDTSNSQFFANANTYTIAESSLWGNPTVSGRLDIAAYGRGSGNVVYWDIYAVKGTLEAADFLTPTSGTITCNGTNNEYGWFGNTITLVPNADNNYEGTEVFRVRFRDQSGSGPIFYETSNITMTDQSGAFNTAVDIVVVGGGGGGRSAGGGGGGTVFRTFPTATFYAGMAIPVQVGGSGQGWWNSSGAGGQSVVTIPATYTPYPQVAINFPAPIVAIGGGASSSWGSRGNNETEGGNGGGAVNNPANGYNPSNAASAGVQPGGSPANPIPAFSFAPAGIGFAGQAAPVVNSFGAGGNSGGAPGATTGQASGGGRPSTIYPSFWPAFGGGGAGATPTNRYDPGQPGGGGNSIINPGNPKQRGVDGTGGGGACAYHVGTGGFGYPGNIDFGNAGQGGSGVVIFRYSGPQKASGGDVAVVPGPATVHVFNSSGTMTFTNPN